MENIRYKILLIEDDKLDQMAFMRIVKDEGLPYDCTLAGSISDGRNVLASDKFDAVISDYSLGDGTAFDVLDMAKDVPVILVTGAGDEETAVKAWRAGACGYVVKDSEQNYLKTIAITVENAVKHKRMGEILDRKQKNLEAIFDAVPVGMLLVDENMIVRRVNNAIKRMLHKDYSQIIERRFGNALGCIAGTEVHRFKKGRLAIPTHGEKECGCSPICLACPLLKSIKSGLDSGQSVREVEIPAKLRVDNKEITPWLCMSIEPVMIDGGKHVVVALNNITESKRAERELKLAEERYRTIFENSAVAITMADEQERLISWNKFTEGLLGMEGKDLHLRSTKSLYPTEEWERMRTHNVRQKGMRHHLETKMIKKNGNVIDVDISLSVLKNPEGRTTASVAVFRDITERKKAEQKIKETMEIKSQFVSTVSHELRTPLAGIKEAVGIVLDGVVGKINDKQKEFLNVAKRNVDRLTKLINGVLDFQKYEAGRVKLNIQKNDIYEVVKDVYDTMAPFARKEGVEISFERNGEVPKIRFDRDKIIQVLINLISNAIKFTPRGGRVSVSVLCQGEDLAIRVSDTGMGIPKEVLSKIFERFYRVQRPGKEVPGTGLGLAIVNKIVMMHQGRVEVESQLDKGTTFTAFLPLAAKPAAEVSPEKADEVMEDTVVKSSN